MSRILLTICLAMIAACSPTKIAENMLTPGERSVVRGAIDDIARNDTPALVRKTPAELAEKVPAAMAVMHPALPQPPLGISVANATWTTDGTTRRLNVVYQVKGKDGWALVQATTETVNQRVVLTSVYVERIQGDPQGINSFNLADAGAGGWAMIAAMFAAIGVTIAALLRIWRSGKFLKPWRWTIGALIGITTFKMNWSTGAIDFQPLSFQILSAGAFKQPLFAPWVLSVSIPVGALFALLYRGHGWYDEYDFTGERPPATHD